jgi:hypothetical protein
MAVKPHKRFGAGRSGQSMLEFLLTLPLLLGLTAIVWRVNQAMQISIMNQQHARAQALHLAQNSSIYPRKEMWKDMLFKSNPPSNQLIAGISSELVADDKAPKTTKQRILASSEGSAGDGANDVDAKKRSTIRVRSTISLCTQSNFIRSGSGTSPNKASALNEGMTPQSFALCQNKYLSGGGIP